MLRRLSLRARLVVGVLVLALVGLGAADVATYTSLRSFLVQRVDTTLESDHQSFEGRGGGPGGGFHGGPGGPSNEFAQWRAVDGTMITSTRPINSFGERDTPQPRLPTTVSMKGAKTSEGGQDLVRFFTVRAT